MASSSRRDRYLGPALLILSAPCWWIGAFAFFPVVGSVYSAPNSATQIKVVSSHPIAWLAQNLCFLSGLLGATGGLAALTKMLRHTRGWRFARLGLLTNLVATAVGVGVVHVYLTLAERQTAAAPRMYSGEGANPLHIAFGVLTLTGFACYGVALVQSGRLKWTGVAGILLSSLMLAEVARYGDAFPPLFSTLFPSCSASAYCLGRGLALSVSRARENSRRHLRSNSDL